MITVFDMTSGTLRKELEENGNITECNLQTEMHPEAAYTPALQLQEIEFTCPEAIHAMPGHMVELQAEDFINSMK